MTADTYIQDGLISVHNHESMGEARFGDAYQRGVAATGTDYQWHWRVHIRLWAAQTAAHLPGDFVECGVTRGFSAALMQRLAWDRLGQQSICSIRSAASTSVSVGRRCA